MGQMERLTIKEARAAPRFPVGWPIELKHGSGKALDFSVSGMYVECNVRVKEGELMWFSVSLPKDDHRAAQKMYGVGRVVRVERRGGGGWGVGLMVSKFQFSNATH